MGGYLKNTWNFLGLIAMFEWIVFVYLIKGSLSLKLVSLDVPEAVSKGSATRLTCGYDLEGDTLYSIKWYRDEVEFFRYVPTDRPPGQFFGLQGIKVDLSQSADGSVFIRDVSPLTAGVYKCEVSADAPSFQTVSAEKNMAVLDSSARCQFSPTQTTFVLGLMLTLLRLQWRWQQHIW